MDSLTSILDLLVKLAPYSQDILEITVSLVVGLYLNGTRLDTIYNIVNRTKLKIEPGKEKILAEKLEPEEIKGNILAEKSESELVEVCEKLACFQTFKNYDQTFEYFGNRIDGKSVTGKAGQIDVTYFVDDRKMSDAEKSAERNYFSKQEYYIMHKGLKVRRILLIKNISDYRKMEEQIKNLRTAPKFELGIYILAENIDPGGNIIEVLGDFKKHLNFNFMVIDEKEFCFGNGNRETNEERKFSSSIMHERLAKEMKKHIDHLWDNSLQVKTLDETSEKSELLTKIEKQCKDINIISQNYISMLTDELQ
jgi:hypothetical protein